MEIANELEFNLTEIQRHHITKLALDNISSEENDIDLELSYRAWNSSFVSCDEALDIPQ